MKDRRIPLQLLLDAFGDGIVVVDGAGRIAHANRAVGALLGYAPDDLVGQPLDLLIPERYRAGHRERVAGMQAPATPHQIGRRPVLHALARDGSERPVTIMLSRLELDGESYGLAVLRDATRFDVLLERAIERSHTDALTGLGNRARLREHLDQCIAAGRPFGLLFLDLTGFKQFNDERGHLAGDEVLRTVGRRLSASVRAGDLAVRWAGDEFVLVLDDLRDADALAARAEAVAAHLREPFAIGAQTTCIGVNIGGARYPADAVTVEALVAAADRAMYRAKAFGVSFAVMYGRDTDIARGAAAAT